MLKSWAMTWHASSSTCISASRKMSIYLVWIICSFVCVHYIPFRASGTFCQSKDIIRGISCMPFAFCIYDICRAWNNAVCQNAMCLDFFFMYQHASLKRSFLCEHQARNTCKKERKINKLLFFSSALANFWKVLAFMYQKWLPGRLYVRGNLFAFIDEEKKSSRWSL